MGVQPPGAGDGEEDAETVEFGIAALDARLDEGAVSFPATASEVIDAAGDVEVAYGPQSGTLTLAEAVRRTDREQFESRNDLFDALHPVFEAERQSRSLGVVGFLRSLVPF